KLPRPSVELPVNTGPACRAEIIRDFAPLLSVAHITRGRTTKFDIFPHPIRTDTKCRSCPALTFLAKARDDNQRFANRLCPQCAAATTRSPLAGCPQVLGHLRFLPALCAAATSRTLGTSRVTLCSPLPPDATRREL